VKSLMATTSQRQGRHREVGSGGSRRQNCGPTNRNVIRGRALGASQHRMIKPFDSGCQVNGAAVRGKLVLLSGEICPAWRPFITCGGAPVAVTAAVIGQKSAEAIVVAKAEGRRDPCNRRKSFAATF
jgi:hypothetical protein